jgi:phosphohistidine phosphatase SixA
MAGLIMCLLVMQTAQAAREQLPDDPDFLWQQLKAGGHAVLIRHTATDPGIGDPPGFRLDDCRTQRNLSATGRQDAEQMGAAFRSRSIPIGKVYSSPWCRCLETARLAFGPAVESYKPLASSFNDGSAKEANANIVKREIAKRLTATAGTKGLPPNVIMVTHQFNIGDITGRTTNMGDAVVVKPDGCCNLRIVGVLPVNAFRAQ